MTRPSDNADFTDLIAGYALGNLSAEEMAQLRLNLAENPQLSQELVAFQEALVLFAYDLPTSNPPAHLKGQMLGEAAASRSPVSAQPEASTSPTSSDNLVRFRRFRRSAWITRVSTGLAAGAIAALGLNQLQLRNQTQQIAQLEGRLKAAQNELDQIREIAQTQQQLVTLLGQSETQVHELVGANPEQVGTEPLRASLLAQPDNQDVVLVTQDLPQLQANQIYRLWAVADTAAAPTYCGQFRQNGEGVIRWTVPDAVCLRSPEQLLVTLDAPEDPITSAGPLVMQSQI